MFRPRPSENDLASEKFSIEIVARHSPSADWLMGVHLKQFSLRISHISSTVELGEKITEFLGNAVHTVAMFYGLPEQRLWVLRSNDILCSCSMEVQ
jgi:hypothetical protein